MKIAIPSAEGNLDTHFGHCKIFDFFEVNVESGEFTQLESLVPPPHEPGVIPRWLGELGVNLVLAGGMGHKALKHFDDQNIQVIVGMEAESTQKLVGNYLAGNVEEGSNLCDH